MSDAERLLWRHLRRRRIDGFRFRRQRPFGPYVCDFICLEARLIIELDDSPQCALADRDARRDDFMRSHGHRVLCFRNVEVTANTAKVLDAIFAALHPPDIDGQLS